MVDSLRKSQLVGALLVLVVGVGCGSDDDNNPADEIQQGTLIDLRDGSVQGTLDGGSRKFLGIPFAAPPVGGLRWRPPQPPEPWIDTLVADTLSPPCPQNEALTTPASDTEDCLYLNVWTPDPAPTEPKPVLFWIHGGGNTSGSTGDLVPLGGDTLFYDGRVLAETRDVVVVTTNYRLNVFGFFSHPALAAEDADFPYSGNQGLQDQRMALEWVRDNIIAFGGDPDNVTIFGESAGSWNVCLHMVSPPSRGLFHRGVSQSGGCTYVQTSLEEADAQSASLIAGTGCAEADDALACLRDLPVSELLGQATADSFGFIVDGATIPEQPRVLYDRGDFAQVPYVLGSNSDEGTLFVLGQPPLESEEEYLAILEQQYGDRADDVAAVYPASAYDSPQDALVRVIGDSSLVCETWDTARRVAAAGVDTYLYNFSRPVLQDILPDLGATHGAEIAFVFGSGADRGTEEDVGVALAIQGYWTRFAASGDPNGEDAFEWPSYDDEADQRINLDIERTLLTGFRREECELWWGFADEDFE